VIYGGCYKKTSGVACNGAVTICPRRLHIFHNVQLIPFIFFDYPLVMVFSFIVHYYWHDKKLKLNWLFRNYFISKILEVKVRVYVFTQ